MDVAIVLVEVTLVLVEEALLLVDLFLVEVAFVIIGINSFPSGISTCLGKEALALVEVSLFLVK
jgi:hypothetical protein